MNGIYRPSDHLQMAMAHVMTMSGHEQALYHQVVANKPAAEEQSEMLLAMASPPQFLVNGNREVLLAQVSAAHREMLIAQIPDANREMLPDHSTACAAAKLKAEWTEAQATESLPSEQNVANQPNQQQNSDLVPGRQHNVKTVPSQQQNESCPQTVVESLQSQGHHTEPLDAPGEASLVGSSTILPGSEQEFVKHGEAQHSSCLVQPEHSHVECQLPQTKVGLSRIDAAQQKVDNTVSPSILYMSQQKAEEERETVSLLAHAIQPKAEREDAAVPLSASHMPQRNTGEENEAVLSSALHMTWEASKDTTTMQLTTDNEVRGNKMEACGNTIENNIPHATDIALPLTQCDYVYVHNS